MSDKTSDKRLLPCPFCGGEAILDREDIFCDNCFLSMKIDSRVTNCEAETYEEARNQAIEAWNTRKPMDKIAEKLGEKLSFYRSASYGNDIVMGIISGIEEAIEIVKQYEIE